MSFIYSDQAPLFGERDVVGYGCVKVIERNAANDVIKNNHYSRKFYNASYIHLGVFSDGELVGVLQFGYAMNPASQNSICENTKIDEYLELNRMWLSDSMPKNSESRAISHATKFIRRKYPQIKWIMSFADERCGLFGCVYQACNFKYFGEHTSVFWELDGAVYHNSLMTRNPNLSKSAAHLQKNKDRAVSSNYRQFRYIYFMKPRFEKLCKLSSFSFPKATSPADELISNQCEEGATPSGRSNNKG